MLGRRKKVKVKIDKLLSQETFCLQCDRCETNPVLAAAKRIICLDYFHDSFDELEGDANIVANALLKSESVKSTSVQRPSSRSRRERSEMNRTVQGRIKLGMRTASCFAIGLWRRAAPLNRKDECLL